MGMAGAELCRHDRAGRLRVHRPGFDGFQVVFQWLRPLPCLAGVPCTAACLRFRSVGPYSSVHKALDSAWRHIQSVEAHCEALEMEQQDLIGFFNSVPHARILQALELLIWRLEELFRHNVEDIVFQVDMKADTKGLRIFRVQQRFSSICHKIVATLSCPGIDNISTQVRLLQSRTRHFLSDSRCKHGITIGSSSLLFGGCRTGISVDS